MRWTFRRLAISCIAVFVCLLLTRNGDFGRAMGTSKTSSPYTFFPPQRFPSIAITTTILHPDFTFPVWLNYHLRRVDLVMIFMDDPRERPLFEQLVRGKPVVLFDGAHVGDELSTPSRLMQHQAMNNEAAISFALANNITWLMHIDTDELFYEDGERSWEVTEGVGLFTFQNHEALPLRDAHEPLNFFEECTLFNAAGRRGFMAYGIGKSAVRVTPGVRDWGPHYFTSFQGEDRFVQRPMILHYPHPTFERWVGKYRSYGNFSNYWDDDPNRPNQLGFMLESRDVVLAALASGDWEEAHNFWNALIPDAATIEELVSDGALLRISPLTENQTATRRRD